jgi:hypothetical protein
VTPEHRLPRTYRRLVAAIDAAGWQRRVTATGPFRCADVIREVVEVQGTTRGGHRVIAWFCAAAPVGQPRPPFRSGGALVGRGRGMADAPLTVAVKYVRNNPAA